MVLYNILMNLLLELFSWKNFSYVIFLPKETYWKPISMFNFLYNADLFQSDTLYYHVKYVRVSL